MKPADDDLSLEAGRSRRPGRNTEGGGNGELPTPGVRNRTSPPPARPPAPPPFEESPFQQYSFRAGGEGGGRAQYQYGGQENDPQFFGMDEALRYAQARRAYSRENRPVAVDMPGALPGGNFNSDAWQNYLNLIKEQLRLQGYGA